MKFERKLKNIIKKNLFGKKIDLSGANNKVFIFLAADYPNLGDIAIGYAQKKFIQQILPNYDIVEVPLGKTYETIKYIKNNCNRNDIITLIGGGNMSSKYEIIEECRREVISNFKDNKIISFPQTIYFSEDKEGQISLRKTIKIYSKHKNLHIFARENMSYKKMKGYFKNNFIYLIPDIVLSLNYTAEDIRDGIIICLRDDKEKILKKEEINSLIKNIEKEYRNISYEDTFIEEDKFSYENRTEILEEFLEKLMKKKLVITDRLHGMIFCYITKTPCIVFNNSNNKIKETYDLYLKDANYIKFFDKIDLDTILKHINGYYKLEEYTKKEINNEYQKLEKVLITV